MGALVLALALGVGSGTAAAQTEEERAGARAAAMEGAKAYEEERWQDAVDLFERAQSLVQAPTHLLYLARANEKLGRLVKARELYNRIVRDPLPPNAPEAFRRAQAEAEREKRAIDPRLARLTVNVEAPAEVSYRVVMDGVAVPPALIGIARPVDPGRREVTVTATGYRADPVAVELPEGGVDSVTVRLIADPAAAGTTAPPAASEPVLESPPLASASGAPQDGGGKGLRVGSFVALGVGVVGVGMGTVFGVRSAGKRSDADALEDELRRDCGDRCPASDPRAEEIGGLDDDARSAMTLSTVGFVVGGIGLATGATLLVVSGRQQARARGPAASLQGFVGPGTIGIRGWF